MKLKGTRRIERIINNFLLPYDCTCFMGTDFGFWWETRRIEFALVVPESMNEGFLQSVMRHNPQVDMDIFLWSFLHEVGHAATLDDFTDDECIEFDEIKEEIDNGDREISEYFDIPDEYAATLWAVEFANTHTEELAKFWKKLQAAILHFYKINEVELSE